MKYPKILIVIVLLGASALLAPSTLFAESFRIRTANNQEGVGYGVTIKGRCYILTVWHLVENKNVKEAFAPEQAWEEIGTDDVNLDKMNKVLHKPFHNNISVESANNHLTFVRLHYVNEAKDMAILVSKNNEHNLQCSSTSTISSRKIRVLSASKGLIVSTADATQFNYKHGSLVNASVGERDDFKIKLNFGQAPFVETDSGSAVLQGEKLIGIVKEKSRNHEFNEASVIPFSVYRDGLPEFKICDTACKWTIGGVVGVFLYAILNRSKGEDKASVILTTPLP